MKDWFISFGTRHGNLGVVIITADCPCDALAKATAAGLNPGGEPAVYDIDKEEADKLGRDKVITPAEMRERQYLSTFDRRNN